MVFSAPKKKVTRRANDKRLSVTQLFTMAVAVYEKDQFARALTAFSSILQRYPAHEPSAVYSAKALYRLERIPESYAQFSRLNINGMDIETSYEYGQVFMAQKNFVQAIVAFQRVPKSHALWDLANYYGAICALNLKQYETAENMLESAVVLPRRLAAKKNLYLAHVNQIGVIAQKSALKKERQKIEKEMNEDIKNAKPAVPTTVPSPPPAYVHSGLKVIEQYADLDFRYRHQNGELHGFGDNNSIHRTFGFRFFNGPAKYYGTSSRKKTMVGMQVHVDVENRSTSGKEIRNIAFDKDSDHFRAQETPYPKGQSRNLSLGLTPFVEFPMAMNFWGLASFNYEHVFPELELDYKGGSHSILLSGYQKEKSYTWGIESSSSWVRGKSFRPTSVKIRNGAFLLADFGSGLLGESYLTYDLFNYNILNASGPDSVTKIDAILSQSFPLGITLGAEGNLSFKKNQIIFDTAQLPYQADGLELGWRLFSDISPLPWLKLSLSHSRSQTKWSVHSPDKTINSRNSFEKLVPNIIMTTEASLAINLLF